MARSFKYDPPSLEIKDLPDIERKEYTIKIVTPMFGGGVKPGENDPAMLIRPTSIRGHLRFWWRVLHGASFDSVAQMRDAENGRLSRDRKRIEVEGIWGSTDIPSKVEVRVLSQPKSLGNREPNQDFGFARFGAESYALFAAKSNGNSLLKEGGEFKIQLSYPKAWTAKKIAQVESAVWAWVNFGGIGARTRRGCGTLYCEDFAPPSVTEIQKWFCDALNKYGITLTATVKEYPMFLGKFYRGKTPVDTLLAWNTVLGIYQRFRQGVDIARNPGNNRNRPGRSRWPEPEAIREITGRRANGHPPIPDHPRNTFPRAEFGLPIITHFIGGGEPNDTQLIPVIGGEEKTRLGSPLILKPLVLQGGQQSVACVMRLQTQRLELVKLQGRQQSYQVCSAQCANYPNSPLRNRSPSGSALEAFMTFLSENHFQEVSR